MSEMTDSLLYNFYDYMKSIYIYSHVKTSLKDTQRQPIEKGTNISLCILACLFLIVSAFKIFVIIFYFIFIQAFTAFFKFILSIYRTRFRINFYSSFKNAIAYLGKVFKRIYTFNFYLFHNFYIGFTMIFSYFSFLISSFGFYITNMDLLDKIEKPNYYLGWFYFHFESVILVQLLVSCFYACHNMKASTLVGLGIFIVLNIILVLGYIITEKIENVYGIYEFSEPQRMMTIIFNTILLFLNGICFFKVLFYRKDSKFKFFYNNFKHF